MIGTQKQPPFIKKAINRLISYLQSEYQVSLSDAQTFAEIAHNKFKGHFMFLEYGAINFEKTSAFLKKSSLNQIIKPTYQPLTVIGKVYQKDEAREWAIFEIYLQDIENNREWYENQVNNKPELEHESEPDLEDAYSQHWANFDVQGIRYP